MFSYKPFFAVLNKFILFVSLMYPVSVYSQVDSKLDYSNYHIKFQDDFLYPDPNQHYPSTAFQTNPTFTKYWSLFPSDEVNDCAGFGSEVLQESHVIMPRNSVIRLIENRSRNESCDPKPGNFRSRGAYHVSGMLRSKRKVNSGIIEARIKLPSGRGRTSAWPAFWIPWGEAGKTFSEIDIVDNINADEMSVTSNMYLNLKKGNNTGQSAFYFFMLAQYAGKTVQPKSLTEPLSADFHKYSCLWTPSRVIFYFDDEYLSHIDYTNEQTCPTFQDLLISLQADTFTTDGLTMDIDWVKYWEQNIDENDFIISANNKHEDIMMYPYLPPCYEKQPQYNCIKHKNILIDVREKDAPSVETQKDWGTVLNAESITILSNFIADQSEYRTKNIFVNDFTYHDVSSNGYLEISPFYIDPDSLNRRAGDDNNNGFNTNKPIIVYPNPNNGIFQISVAEPGDYEIGIFNVVGMSILTTAIKNDDRKEITLGSTTPSGTYIIHVKGKSCQLIEKLSLIK